MTRLEASARSRNVEQLGPTGDRQPVGLFLCLHHEQPLSLSSARFSSIPTANSLPR